MNQIETLKFELIKQTGCNPQEVEDMLERVSLGLKYKSVSNPNRIRAGDGLYSITRKYEELKKEFERFKYDTEKMARTVALPDCMVEGMTITGCLDIRVTDIKPWGDICAVIEAIHWDNLERHVEVGKEYLWELTSTPDDGGWAFQWIVPEEQKRQGQGTCSDLILYKEPDDPNTFGFDLDS